MSYQYTYLYMGLTFGVFWFILFFLRKDTRREMLRMSIFCSILGPISEVVYTQDWWTRPTLFGNILSIEPLLTAFMVCGTASVIYKVLWKKKVVFPKESVTKNKKRGIMLVLFAVFILGLFYGGFFLLNLNSFITTIISVGVATLVFWFIRRDLIVCSLITGGLMVVVAAITYSVLELLTPGWIFAFWHFVNVPPIVIFNLPIDDLVAYFLIGTSFGPLYLFMKNGRFVTSSSR